MTVGELFHSVALEPVLAEIAKHYPNQREDDDGYRRAWAAIQRMQPATTEMICALYQDFSMDDPPESYVGVHGKIVDDPASYAIEYTKWPEWLSMPVMIAPELVGMKEPEILAHVFWEMTWVGCDEEVIQSQFTDILDLADEAKAALNREVH